MHRTLLKSSYADLYVTVQVKINLVNTPESKIFITILSNDKFTIKTNPNYC